MKTPLLSTLSIFLCLLSIISCHRIPNDVQFVLNKASANRDQLEKVIEHYQTTGEKEKLKATYFLIANMEGKRSEYYGYPEKVYELFYKGKKNKVNQVSYKETMKRSVDSLIRKNITIPLVVYDMDIITANYLIENIDLAFEAWQEPWACHFTFEEFCEYVLPYRIAKEPLSNWRKTFYTKYKWVKDSVKNVHDTREVLLYLNDLIGDDFWVEGYLELPYVAVTLLDKVKGGGCNQRYLLMISVLRAMGIPAMMDYAPSQNNTYKDHSWTVYINPEHKYCPFDGGRPRRKLFDLDYLPNAFLDSMIIPLADGWGSNVFRYTYSNHPESLGSRVKDWNSIPPLFRTTAIRNVTDQYLFSQQRLTDTIPTDLQLEDDLVYLSVFGYGENIREADWCYVKEGKVEFPHMGTHVVYLLSQYINEELKPFSYPIWLKDSTTRIVLKPDLENRRRVVLTRKSQISLQMQGFSNSMAGARFEGSHFADFQNPMLLYQIDEAPTFLTEKESLEKEKYRYVRYTSPLKDIHVAELQFVSRNSSDREITLKGEPMGYLSTDSFPDAQIRNCFDNNIKTNFDASRGSWVGLDLKSPQQITGVKYLPRNNFNTIEVGNKYELLYYDLEWKSLEIKETENQYLVFDNVPEQALLLLKNLTQGKEERIFTYENQTQWWW